MTISNNYINFKLWYQLSPIILGPGGITTQQGGGIPIVLLTSSTQPPPQNILVSVLSGNGIGFPSPELDDYFAHYYPMAGASLIQNQVAMYPFANQTVAANAIIAQPLNISMVMICPAGNKGGYGNKQTIMMALQGALAKHNNLGGLYSVCTPSYIYTNCIMTAMTDISGGESKQSQFMWRLDFIQPLVSVQQAQQAQNNLMQKLTSGAAIQGAPSWSSGLPVGNPATTFASSLVPNPVTNNPQELPGDSG